MRLVSRLRCLMLRLASTAAACSRLALLRDDVVGCIKRDLRARVLLAGGPAARVFDLVFRAGACGLTGMGAFCVFRFRFVARRDFWLGVSMLACVFTLGAAGVNTVATRCTICCVIDRV